MNKHKLPNGPIFGPRFVPWSWMAMEKEGKDVFQIHTYNEVVDLMVKYCPLQRNVDFAAIMQDNYWD